MKDQSQRGKGPIDLIDEAFQLLRSGSLSTLAFYYLGAAPFVLGLLFFWSDMSRGALAEARLAPETLGLVILFLWMKTCQVLFVRQLRAQLFGSSPTPLTFKGFARIVAAQSILQPSGLFLIPLALFLLFPIGWVYAFYQNVTVLGACDDYEFKDVYRKVLKQSAAWPLQNTYLVFLLKAFGLFVFLNVFSGLVLIPHLLSMFLGVETAFVQTTSSFMNTTFVAAVVGLTYLCIDPLVKSLYLLRCFYGESRQTGEDLKAELRLHAPALQKAAALILSCALVIASFSAASTAQKSAAGSPSPLGEGRADGEGAAPAAENAKLERGGGNLERSEATDLDQAIEEVLQQPEYTWRLPREKVQERADKPTSFLDRTFASITDWIKKALRSIDRFLNSLKPNQPSPSGGSLSGLSWLFGARGLIAVLILVVAVLLAWLLLRLWKDREPDAEQVAAEAIVPVPDLEDEDLAADQLPEDGWMTLARDLLGRGELRLALRALYLASLAHLAQRNLISIARFKSNRDYERELSRRAHALPDVMRTFTENVSIFDRIWYGLHDVNKSLLDHFQRNVEKINAA